MANHSPIYVVDTSLIIDMHIGQILASFFKLPYRFITPDVIIAELLEPDGKLLIKIGLQQEELSAIQVSEVMRLKTLYRYPSVNDLFALVLAQGLQAPLLTNDRNLRRAAEQEAVSVHGTLWVLDEMVRLLITSKRQAANALVMMREKGSRLPQDECDKRLAEWLDT